MVLLSSLMDGLDGLEVKTCICTSMGGLRVHGIEGHLPWKDYWRYWQ